MISNPKHGWCSFDIADFHGHPSYLTDVPVDLLQAFVDLHKKGSGCAFFDEEGSDFTFVLNPNGAYIISSASENPVIYDLSDIKIIDLQNELIEDIETNIEEWSKEFVIDDDKNEITSHKNCICKLIKELKEL